MVSENLDQTFSGLYPFWTLPQPVRFSYPGGVIFAFPSFKLIPFIEIRNLYVPCSLDISHFRENLTHQTIHGEQ